jgi:hypothetical protein
MIPWGGQVRPQNVLTPEHLLTWAKEQGLTETHPAVMRAVEALKISNFEEMQAAFGAYDQVLNDPSNS